MDRPNYVKLFSNPDNYKPPDDSELSTNTHYPNLNSTNYHVKPVTNEIKIKQFFEALCLNDDGKNILASNDLRGRVWNGSVCGFENINDVGNQEKICFSIDCDSAVTNLLCLKYSLFVLSTAAGGVQLWSTKAEMRKTECSKGYCLLMIRDRREHDSMILSMDTLSQDEVKFVTGSNDYCLKIWDAGCADLFSIHTIRNAHSDSITGISGSNSNHVFVTCSRDKCALIWDYRQPRPAKGLYDDYKFSFTSVYWSKEHEKNEQVVLGDESGRIHFTDVRVPNKFISSHEIYERPIRKTRFHMKNVVILGNTNIVKAFRCAENDILQLVYEDSRAKDLVRDVQWDLFSESEFHTIGWDKNIYKHKIELT